MRSKISSSPRLPASVLLLLVVGLLGITPSSMSAQTIECVDEPLLEFFDENGDGELREEEIRAADPDNAELQSMADRMDDEGVAGLQYTGCVPPDAGSDAGTPEGGTPEGGTPEGGTPEGGTPEVLDDGTDASSEGITTLPENGETSDDGGFNPAFLVIGVGALLALVFFLGFRWRNRA